MEKLENNLKNKNEINISEFNVENKSEQNVNDKISIINIDNHDVFKANYKILEIKKKFKNSLYEKRLFYGKLCNLGLVNQNLRFAKNFTIDELQKNLIEDENLLFNDKQKDENNDITLTLNETERDKAAEGQTKEKKIDLNDYTNSCNLKIKLNGNFRHEIEKINYDANFNLNLRPAKRELRLLKMLKEKVNKLNSLN